MTTVARSPAVANKLSQMQARLQLLVQTNGSFQQSTTPRDKAAVLDDALEVARYFASEHEFLEHQLTRLKEENDVLRWNAKSSSNTGVTFSGNVSSTNSAASSPGGTAANEEEDIRRLADEIATIEKEITTLRGAAGSAGSSAAASTLEKQRLRRPTAVTQRVLRMVETKAAKYDDLLQLYRKRLTQFSEIQGYSGEIISQFGSIASLFDGVAQLKKENEALRVREVRYASSSLLKRRNLRECDAEFLRVMVMALQSELAHALNTVESLSSVSRAQMSFGSGGAPKPLGQMDVPQYLRELEDVGCERDDDPSPPLHNPANVNKSSAVTSGASATATADENESLQDEVARVVAENRLLAQKLNATEHANIAFQGQVRFYESEVEKLRAWTKNSNANSTSGNLAATNRSQTGTSSECTDPVMLSLSKKIRELTRQQDSLLDDVKNLQEQLFRKTETVKLQADVIQEQARDRELLNKVMADWTRRFDAVARKLTHQTKKAGKLVHANRVLSTIAVALAHAQWESLAKDNVVSARQLVNHMFSDVMRVYALTVDACVRIQSWFRGLRTRRSRGLPSHLDKTHLLPAAVRGERLRLSQSPKVATKHQTLILSLLDVYAMLFEALHATHGANHAYLKNYTTVLKNLVRDVKGDVKNLMTRDLQKYQHLFHKDAATMLKAFQHAMAYPRVEKMTQTNGNYDGRSTDIQTDAKVVQDVEIQALVEVQEDPKAAPAKKK